MEETKKTSRDESKGHKMATGFKKVIDMSKAVHSKAHLAASFASRSSRASSFEMTPKRRSLAQLLRKLAAARRRAELLAVKITCTVPEGSAEMYDSSSVSSSSRCERIADVCSVQEAASSTQYNSGGIERVITNTAAR